MKRALALLLACLMTLGFAVAETDDAARLQIAQADAEFAEESVAEAGALLFSNDETEDGGEEAPGETLDEEDPPEEVPPTEIALKKSATRTVWLGTAYRFTVSGKAVKSYKSSVRKIATVDGTGLIALKKAGKVKITATLKGGKTVILTLKVLDPAVPTGVAIAEGKKGTLIIGDTLSLSAAVSPETAEQAVKWTSSDKAVANVDETGLVTPLRSGKATITATTVNKLKATFALTVRRPETEPFMISHACGGVGGYSYSNCLEGFVENYAEGHRIFEVDIEYTSDGKMVLCHDWKRQMYPGHRAGTRPTYAQFMGAKIFGKYTPLDIEGLLRLMDQYPDATVITDSKYDDTATVKKQFTTLVKTARELGLENTLDRFVVELYNKKMLKTVKNVYPFRAYMLTLYKLYKKAPSKSQLKDVAAFCRDNGITMLAMYTKWWKSSYMSILDDYDVDGALYTTNSASDARKYLKQGITALFTDFLPPLAG